MRYVRCNAHVASATLHVYRYASELEAEILRIENESHDLHSPEWDKSSPNVQFDSFRTDEGDTDIIIDEMFQEHESLGDERMQSLLEGFSQVSLSATTKGHRSSDRSQNVLLAIILSAAIPGDLLHGFSNLPPVVGLPPKELAGKALQRYTKEVLPHMPFISLRRLDAHFEAAYRQANAVNDHGISNYSIFLISCIISSTSLHMSQTSLPNAANLFRSAMYHFIDAARDVGFLEEDLLRNLEAVIAMCQFAEFSQRVLNSDYIGIEMDGSRMPDFWQLSGIAVRMAVDLGLHKNAKIKREHSMLQAALTLDRNASVNYGGLPTYFLSNNQYSQHLLAA